MASSLLVCSLILTFVGISMAVYCSEQTTFGFGTTYKYCAYSCCGSSYSRYCCGSGGMSIPGIVGIVIGVLFLVALVVGIIICCVCCMKSTQGHRGQVMRPHQPHVTVVSGSTNAAYSPGYSIPAYPGQPQPGTVYPPPTAYSPPTGAAYPPPAPAAGFAVPPPVYNEAAQGYPMSDVKS